MTHPGSPPWHALLAPLPDDAVPERGPAVSPEIAATPEGASVAGWETIALHLSAGAAGLRTLLVTIDARGEPVSAGDTILVYLLPDDPASPARHRTESIGGRLEPDGSFRGTHWRTLAEERDEDDPAVIEQEHRPPTDAEAAALRSLVATLLQRMPPRTSPD